MAHNDTGLGRRKRIWDDECVFSRHGDVFCVTAPTMDADQAIASILGFLAERTIGASEMEMNCCSIADRQPFDSEAERDHLASRINS